MKEFVEINEVGLRDGIQNQPIPVTTENKIALAKQLINSGIKHLEVTSFVHPKAVPQMADAGELVTQLLPLQQNQNPPSFTALIPNIKGFARAKEAGIKKVALVLATTDTFNKKNINMSLEQAFSTCLEVIREANAANISVRTYLACACACPYEGKTPLATTINFANELINAGSDEISIADTIGAGNPLQIKQILTPLLTEHSPSKFNLHLHDTQGQALAMAWAGLEAGIRKFDSSIGGMGGCPFAPGATGNLATEDLVHMLHEMGFETGIEWDKLLAAINLASAITAKDLGGKILPWALSSRARN